jgi:hypothetical protein
MFEPEVEYPFWQPEPPLPYQPYRGQTDPSPSQQQAFISPYATPRATVVYSNSWFSHTPGEARLVIRREELFGVAGQIRLGHIPSV